MGGGVAKIHEHMSGGGYKHEDAMREIVGVEKECNVSLQGLCAIGEWWRRKQRHSDVGLKQAACARVECQKERKEVG